MASEWAPHRSNHSTPGEENSQPDDAPPSPSTNDQPVNSATHDVAKNFDRLESPSAAEHVLTHRDNSETVRVEETYQATADPTQISSLGVTIDIFPDYYISHSRNRITDISLLEKAWKWLRGQKTDDLCIVSRLSNELLKAMSQYRTTLAGNRSFYTQWCRCFDQLEKDKHRSDLYFILEAYDAWLEEHQDDWKDSIFHLFIFLNFRTRHNFDVDTWQIDRIESVIVSFLCDSFRNDILVDIMRHTHESNPKILLVLLDCIPAVLKTWIKLLNESGWRWRSYLTLLMTALVCSEFIRPKVEIPKDLLKYAKLNSVEGLHFANSVETLSSLIRPISFLAERKPVLSDLLVEILAHFRPAEVPLLSTCEELAMLCTTGNLVLNLCKGVSRLSWWKDAHRQARWLVFFADKTLTLHQEGAVQWNSSLLSMWKDIFHRIHTQLNEQEQSECVKCYRDLLHRFTQQAPELLELMMHTFRANIQNLSSRNITISMLHLNVDMTDIVLSKLSGQNHLNDDDFELIDVVFRKEEPRKKIELAVRLCRAAHPLQVLRKCPGFAEVDPDVLQDMILRNAMKKLHSANFPVELLKQEPNLINEQRSLPILYLLHNQTLSEYSLNFASGLTIYQNISKAGQDISNKRLFEHSNTCSMFMAGRIMAELAARSTVADLLNISTLPLLYRGAIKIANEMRDYVRPEIANSHIVEKNVDQIRLNCESICLTFTQFAEKFSSRRVTIPELTFATYEFDKLRPMFDVLNIPFKIEDLDEKQIEFGNAQESLERHHAMLAWLQLHGIVIESSPKPDMACVTLEELGQNCSLIANSARNKLENSVVEMLLSFLNPPSPIFKLVYRNLQKDGPASEKMTPSDVANLVKKVRDFLLGLVEQDVSLSTLLEILEEIGAAKFESLWNQEIKRVSEFFDKLEPSMKEKAKSLNQTLSNVRDWQMYAQDVGFICDALRELRVELPGGTELAQFQNLVRNKQSVTSGQLQDQLDSIRRIIGPMPPAFLKYFEAVACTTELIRFCRDPDFDNRLTVVRGIVQGIIFDTNLLNMLLTSKAILNPVLDIDKCDSVKQLCERVRNDPSLQSDLVSKLQQLRQVCDNLPTLRDWFSTSSEVRSTMPMIKRARYFRIKSDERSANLELVLRTDSGEIETHLAASLETRLRGIRVFVDNRSLGDDYDTLTNIERCFAIAKEICVAWQQLGENGHPFYLSSIFSIGEALEMDLGAYEETLRCLRQDLANWKSALASSARRNPRLLMLNAKCTSRFLLKIKALLENDKTPSRMIYSNLIPYVLLSFPECDSSCRQESRILITPDVVVEALRTAAAVLQPMEASADRLSLINLIAVAGNTLSSISTSAPLMEHLSTFQPSPSLPKVVRAYGITDWEALRLHVRLCDYIPHPAQILYVDKDTTETDLINLLTRAQHFSHLVYIIHGVNDLLPSLRNYLSQRAADIALSRNRDGFGLIYMIFTENKGVDLFNFLETDSIEMLAESTFIETFPASMFLQKRFIDDLHCLSIEGKTTLIQNQIYQHGNQLHVTVTEDFTPRVLINKISKVILSDFAEGTALCDFLNPHVALHLDISAYAPLRKLSHLLDSFLYWGLFIDPHSGHVLHCMDTIGHLDSQRINRDSHIRWTIFIELSLPPQGDQGFEQLKTTKSVLDRLPSVKHLMSPITLTPIPLSLTSGHFLIANFERASMTAAFSPERQLVAPNMEPGLVVQQLEALLQRKNIFGLRFRTMFLTILADSCRFFANYWKSNCRMWNEIVASGPAGGSLQREEYENARRLLAGALKTYHLLVEEARYCASIGQEEASTTTLPLISSRAYARLGGNVCIERLKFLSFQPENSELLRSTPQYIFFCHNLIEATEDTEVEQGHSWAELRVDLAAGLKMERTERLRPIIEQQRYILTEQFVAKLFVIHARHQTQNNVILVGDTGQGKTELLHLYSTIVNADSDNIPDILENMSQLIENFCLENGLFKEPALEFDHGNVNVGEPVTEQMLIIQKVRNHATVELIMEIAEKILDIEIEDQDKESKYLIALGETVLNYLSIILPKFPLIIKTDFIERIAECYSAGAFAQPIIQALQKVSQRHTLLMLINEILNIRCQNVFHRILMHKGKTSHELINKVKRISELCVEHTDIKMVLFIDEFNTTSVMGVLKEILVDRSIDSQPLPKNLFVIAAMNPPNTVEFQKEYNFAGGASMQRQSRSFAVRPPHLSMNALMFHFPSLKEADEESFINAYIDRHSLACLSNEERLVFKQLLRKSQQYIRNARIKNMHPSIRDILRAGELFNFFRKTAFGATLLSELTIEEARAGKKVAFKEAEPFCNHFWKAMLMSLTMGYSFRLESGFDTTKYKYNRIHFGEKIQQHLDRHPNYPQDLHFYGRMGELTVAEQTLRSLYRNTEIPPGIAMTSALLENLFCIVVCVEIRMPLTICGPPGCSKTLAYTIACDNMKGAQSSPRDLYRLIGQMHRFRYQCSEMSTDVEVEGVFNNAIALQSNLSSACASAKQAGNCCVLLDEAGLPNEEHQPLKVLHHLQDHPKVGSIVLTNKWLDAAKTNRTLQLLQTNPTTQDLKVLVAGCIFGERSINQLDPISASIVSSLHTGYCAIRDDHILSKKFHLRDFVYFLRYVRRSCFTDDGAGPAFHLTKDALMKALLRNFNGDVTLVEFKGLASRFFDAIAKQLRPEFHEFQEMPLLSEDNALEPLRESTSEQLKPEENINTSAFRYICLLDPTDSEMAVRLFLSLQLCANCVVLRGSDFEEDSTDAGNADLIMRLKNAMAEGQTVLLVAATRIFGSFYDVFNKHFTTLTLKDSQSQNNALSASSNKQPEKEYYANVAVGALSRPCKLDPRFRVIVHLPRSQLQNTPAPFLNRFEKFELSVRNCLDDRLAVQTPFGGGKNITMASALRQSCHDFVSKLNQDLTGMAVFHGLVKDETINSLVLRVVQKGDGDILRPLDIVHSAEYNDDEPPLSGSENETSWEWMHFLAKQTNFKLLQLVRPETVYESRLLNADYMSEYMLRQNHLSVARFLQCLIGKHAAGGSFIHASRWCIYTRSSSELACMHKDASLQSSLCSFINQGSAPDADVLDPSPAGITIRALSEISSLNNCKKLVDEFFNGQNLYLIITADMSQCTHNQINILRSSLDERMMNECSRLAILILHAPPELSIQKGVYPALFVENWDFFYIDSMGFSESERSFNEVQLHAEEQSMMIDIDARKWIAHGYGFRFSEISPLAIINSFKPILLQKISVALLSIIGIQPHMLKELVFSKAVYLPSRQPGSNETHSNALRTIMEREEGLCGVLLAKFAEMWCGKNDANESILNTVIKAACLSIRNGNVTGSLALAVRHSLDYLMFSIVNLAIVNLLSNFNLEAIARLESPDAIDVDIQRLFINAATALIKPPSIRDLFNVTGGGIRKRNLLSAAVSISTEIQIVPTLPMYDLVAKSILSLISAAQSELRETERNAANIAVKIRKYLDEDSELGHVISLIENQAAIQNRFCSDFLQRTLKLSRLNSAWQQLFDRVCQRLANAFEVDLPFAFKLFFVKFFDGEVITTSLDFLVPLQKIDPTTTLQQHNIDIERFGLLKEAPDQKQEVLDYFFGKVTIHVLWSSFTKSLCDQGENTEEMTNWIDAFRCLQIRIELQNRIENTLNTTEKTKYHVMLVSFLFVRHFGWQQSFPAMFLQNLRGYDSDVNNVVSLKDAINLISNLGINCAEVAENVDVIRSIVEDLVQQFLDFNGFQANRERNDFSEKLDDTLTTLLSLYGQRSASTSPVALLKRQWLLATLYPLMSNKPLFWTRKFRDIFHKLIQNDVHKNGEPAAFIPHISKVTMQDFAELPPDIERPLFQHGIKNVNPLESLLFDLSVRYFFCTTKHFEPSSTDNKPAPLSGLLEDYDVLLKSFLLEPNQRAERIHALAFGCVVIHRFSQQASVLSVEALTKELRPKFRENMRILLHPDNATTAWEHACPADGFCALLQNIKSSTHLNDILQNYALIEYLGIPNWEGSSQAKNRKKFMFRFLQNPRHESPLSSMVKTVRRLLAAAIVDGTLDRLLDFVEENTATIPGRYNIRFVLILVFYYDYFVAKLEPIPLIQRHLSQPTSRLVQLLHLSPAELNALRFAASGPNELQQVVVEGRRQRREVMEMYSISTLQDGGHEIAHSLFNILAVAFGSPEKTNLLYGHIFRPIVGRNTCGPGSYWEDRMNIDCGFKLETLHQLQQGNPTILGNVLRHRYALNAMYWLSLVWSLLVDEIQGVTACRSDHFINAIGEELFNNMAITVTSPTVTTDHLRQYLFVRGQRFFEMLSHCELQERQMDATHYFTEILLEIQNACNQTNRAVGWRSSWNSVHEVVESEACLQRLFLNVEQTYGERRNFFVSNQDAIAPCFELIGKWQNASQNQLFTTLPSIDVFQEALGLYRRQFDEGSSEDQCLEFLELFWTKRSQYAVSNTIPRLIKFFKKISDKFAYRLLFEDTLAYSVPRAIKKVLGRLEPQAVINEMLLGWEQFKKDWSIIRKHVPQLDGCMDVQANRAFELTIPVVDDQSSLGYFLQHPDRPEEHDHIRSILTNLIDRQNKLLEARDACTDLGNLPISSIVPWNLELSCSGIRQFKIPLERLNNDAVAVGHLIVGDLPVEMRTADAEYTELETFILAHMDFGDQMLYSQVTFDFRRILAHIIQRYTCERLQLQSVRDGLDIPFQYGALGQTYKTSSNIEDNLGLFCGNYEQGLRDYLTRIPCGTDVPPTTKQNWKKVLRASQSELNRCVLYLTQVAARVYYSDDENLPQKFIAVAIDGCPDVLRAIAEFTQIHNLHSLSEFVLDRLQNKAYLFHQPEYAHFEKDFSDETATELRNRRCEIMASKDLQSLLKDREHIETLLNEVVGQNLFELLRQLETCPSQTPINDLPHLRQHKKQGDFAEYLLPAAVTVESFTNYLRFLHCLLSDIDSEVHVLRSQTNPDRPSQKYEELIPDVFQRRCEPGLNSSSPNTSQVHRTGHEESDAPNALFLCEPLSLDQALKQANNEIINKVDCNTYLSPSGHEDAVMAAMRLGDSIDWTDDWKDEFTDVVFTEAISFRPALRSAIRQGLYPDVIVDNNGNTLMHLALLRRHNEFAECYLELVSERMKDGFSGALMTALTIANRDGVTIRQTAQRIAAENGVNDLRARWMNTFEYFAVVDENFKMMIQA